MWQAVTQQFSAAFCLAALAACGLTVPAKFVSEPPGEKRLPDGRPELSENGKIESAIISNIRCEIRRGLYRSIKFGTMPYLQRWGTKVTLTITFDELSGLTPSLARISPLLGTEVFSLAFGVSATAHATREEKITFTLANRSLLKQAQDRDVQGIGNNCDQLENGVFVESDLQIDQFIFDKSSIASGGEATTGVISHPQFSVFQETITFVASIGGNVTPSWKFTKLTANTATSLVNATRTVTSVVLITLGPLEDQVLAQAPELNREGTAQHQIGLIGGSVGSSIISQMPR